MSTTLGYAAKDSQTPLAPFRFERRALRPHDVAIDIAYCGVCHSDIHQARNEWGGATYPMVPGHEIVGRVTGVGSEVRKFAKGDLVGVGCMVDSCRTCAACRDGEEQYCEKGMVGTYNGKDRVSGEATQGGYSKAIVVDQDFVLRVPSNLPLERVAPLLCAGITTYSPLKHWNVHQGSKVGIVGLGGLGHMGVKIAKAMGATVTVFTTSPNKKDDALRLGATDVVVTRDAEAMKNVRATYDFLLDTVSAPHDLNPYLALLKRNGTLVLVGLPTEPPSIQPFNLIGGRRSVAGSLIGGIPQTQEMLDFCGRHNIGADVELIPMEKINEAFERTIKADVKYRFVIDMATLKG